MQRKIDSHTCVVLERAFVALDRVMDEIVTFEFVLPVELSATYFTFEGFFSSMNEVVHFEVLVSFEALFTYMTLVQI